MPWFDIRGQIPPTRFTPRRVIDLVVNSIQEEVGDIWKKDFDKTVSTWRHQPQLKIEPTANGAKVRIGSIKIGRRMRPIWKYLDEGTAKRYAVMSKDFVAKTSIGKLQSRAGRGGKAYIASTPKPGIKARGWSDIIKRKTEKAIKNGIRKAIKNGLLSIK